MILIEVHNLKYDIKDRVLLDVEHLTIHTGDRIGLVGTNGSGKTTLLQLLVGRKSPNEGSIIRRATCHLLPQLKRVDPAKSGGEVTQSYIRDAIAQNPELLLADEPTTNLDTEHIEWLEKQLAHWKGAFVLVSHDRAFLDALCTSIWEIKDGVVKPCTGNYSDYVEQKELQLRQQKLAYEKYHQKQKSPVPNRILLRNKKSYKKQLNPLKPDWKN